MGTRTRRAFHRRGILPLWEGGCITSDAVRAASRKGDNLSKGARASRTVSEK